MQPSFSSAMRSNHIRAATSSIRAAVSSPRPPHPRLFHVGLPLAVVRLPLPESPARLHRHVLASTAASCFTNSAATTAASSGSTAMEPRFSAGSDEAALQSTLGPLLARWSLTADGEGLERSFKFKTFAKTWDFMTAVSLQCKLKNHHPEWSNVYNTTFIRWTTHNPKGLSEKDIVLAGICDALAKDYGELLPEGVDGSCVLRAVADRATAAAGAECCTPAPKKATPPS